MILRTVTYSSHHDHKVIARVHSVHMMNAEQCRTALMGADTQTKPPDLGCESTCRLLSSTTTIAIYYYYSARKLSKGGWKAAHSPCPRL